MIHITDMESGRQLFDALSSQTRIRILEILKQQGETNMQELAQELDITNGAVTSHIKKLQDAKLIHVRSRSGIRGIQKVCSLAASKIIVDLFDEETLLKNVYSFDIGVGHYVDYEIAPTCGLVTDSAIIGELDDPRYFAYPERIDARLIWFTTGHVTYKLPNSLRISEICTELQIGMELASEAPGYTTYYPSDVSFKLNGVDLGYITLPGEYNDRRGIFTPLWWFENLGQYGKLKLLTVNEEGSFIDGLKISDVCIDDLKISPQSDITFSIEAREDAINKGGVSIFGKGFGDYDHGITVKMFYRTERKVTSYGYIGH